MEWSSGGNAFNVDDYGALLRAINSLKDEESANAESLIEIYAEPLEVTLVSGMTVVLGNPNLQNHRTRSSFENYC